MSRWIDRAETLLYEGETIETSVQVGESGVVVTTHRVLTFTPGGDGANYQYVERPNVEGASLGHVGDTDWLEYAAKGGLVGAVGVVVGTTVDFGGLVSFEGIDTSGAGQIGVGGMLGMMRQVVGLLDVLDTVLLVGGLVALTFGLGAFGMYLQSRTHVLELEVAGKEDIRIPVPASARGGANDDPAQRVREAISLGTYGSPGVGEDGPGSGEDGRPPGEDGHGGLGAETEPVDAPDEDPLPRESE